MDKQAFSHVIRAAAAVVDDELVVVGSQAILGTVADPPEPLVRSLEVDLYPKTHPDRAIEIDGALGDGSPFHEHYGYYAHAVGPETITAPTGWFAAGRTHDIEFVEAALTSGLTSPDELRLGVDLLPQDVRGVVRERADGLIAKVSRRG